MSNYIVEILFHIGILIFGISLIKYASDGNKIYGGIALLGLILVTSGLFLGLSENSQGEQELIEEVAAALDANTTEIIIEDLSERSFLGNSKNTSLRRVYYKNETYILEVKSYKLEKIIKEN